jgi:hypothetical protein
MNCPSCASTVTKERTKKTVLGYRTFCCESRADALLTNVPAPRSTIWNTLPILSCLWCSGGCGTS